jgi:hypothetical protein
VTQVGDAFRRHGNIVYKLAEGAMNRAERRVGGLTSHFIFMLQMSQPVCTTFVRPALQLEPNLLRAMVARTESWRKVRLGELGSGLGVLAAVIALKFRGGTIDWQVSFIQCPANRQVNDMSWIGAEGWKQIKFFH